MVIIGTMVRRIALAALYLVVYPTPAFASHSADWLSYDHSTKVSFINGVATGIRINGSTASLIAPKSLWEPIEKDALFEHNVIVTHVDGIIGEMDNLYSDPANADIPIYLIAQCAVFEFTGTVRNFDKSSYLEDVRRFPSEYSH